MSYQNISVVLPPADLTTAKNNIAATQALLPFLVNLSSSERRSLTKTGPGSVGFVQTSLSCAKNHPEILPPSFNVAELEKDVNLFSQLAELLALVKVLATALEQTTMAVGSEAMRAALQFYELLKSAAKTNPGLQPLVDELARRFKQKSHPAPGHTSPQPGPPAPGP